MSLWKIKSLRFWVIFWLGLSFGSWSQLDAAEPSVDAYPALEAGALQEQDDWILIPRSKTHRFSPLIIHDEDGFDVNPVFERQLPNMLKAIRLSYDVVIDFFAGRKDYRDHQSEMFETLAATDGWQVIPFQGKTGAGYFNDIPGIVAVHRDERVLIVALHGSIHPGDWLVNGDWRKHSSADHGLSIPGKIHSGYAMKVSQFQDNLKNVLADIFADLSDEEQKDLVIFMTGHSHGAALAQLTGPVVVDFLKETWKPDFNNAVENKVLTYRLASPRSLGDQESYDGLAAIMGADNNIRQNMTWDAVPIIIPGEEVQACLGWLTGGLSENVWGHRNGGKLALQHSMPALKGNLKRHYPSLGLTTLRNWCSLFINGCVNPHFIANDSPGSLAFGFDPSLVDCDTRTLLQSGFSLVQRKCQRSNHSLVKSSLETLHDIVAGT